MQNLCSKANRSSRSCVSCGCLVCDRRNSMQKVREGMSRMREEKVREETAERTAEASSPGVESDIFTLHPCHVHG